MGVHLSAGFPGLFGHVWFAGTGSSAKEIIHCFLCLMPKEKSRKGKKYGAYDSSTHPNDSFFLPIFFILLQKFRTKTISDSKMYSSLYSWPFRIPERKIDKNCNFTCKWKEQRIDFISFYVNQTRPLCYAFGTVE